MSNPNFIKRKETVKENYSDSISRLETICKICGKPISNKEKLNNATGLSTEAYPCHITCLAEAYDQTLTKYKKLLNIFKEGDYYEGFEEGCNIAKREICWLHELIRLEWSGRLGTVPGEYCPVCQQERADGHAPDCTLESAIKKAGMGNDRTS